LIPPTVPEVRRTILAMAEPEEKRRFRLGWSLFRRAHQSVAKRCHQASHAARQALRPQRTPSPSGHPTTTPTGTAPTNEAVARLTDQEWERVRSLLPPHPPPAGSAGRDHRTTLEGVLWVLNNGASWRDLPEEEFGPWETVYGRYRRWRKEGRWQQVVETLLADETR
jgi:hypothetical protein